jgi:hypothetical protein
LRAFGGGVTVSVPNLHCNRLAEWAAPRFPTARR